MCPRRFEQPSKFLKYEDESVNNEQVLANINDIDLFNSDSLIEGDVEKIVGNVTGSGYR